MLKMNGVKNNKLIGGYIKYILLNEFLVYDGNIFFKKKSITVKL